MYEIYPFITIQLSIISEVFEILFYDLFFFLNYYYLIEIMPQFVLRSLQVLLNLKIRLCVHVYRDIRLH